MAPPPDSWPDDEDYCVALQDPKECFTDSRLQAAAIGLDDFGLPDPVSGRSAIVFRAKVDGRDIAIRCFYRNVPGQRKRYQALAKHLRKSAQPFPEYLIEFAYRDNVMLVNGFRYPLLEMGWSQGSGMHAWVQSSLGNGPRLRELAARWAEVVADLRDRGIAHGDLSTDNCRVRGASDITLIDYDGCYIPALGNADPGEEGHPDYQHPERGKYYGPTMDAFPSLVVYLSLLALAADRGLWEFNNGENLIFTADDYSRPGKTRVWSRLAENPDPGVRSLARELAAMCGRPIATLPPLSEIIAAHLPAPGTGPPSAPGPGHPRAGGTNRPRWMEEENLEDSAPGYLGWLTQDDSWFEPDGPVRPAGRYAGETWRAEQDAWAPEAPQPAFTRPNWFRRLYAKLFRR